MDQKLLSMVKVSIFGCLVGIYDGRAKSEELPPEQIDHARGPLVSTVA